MDFGEALQLLKMGNRVARAGWAPSMALCVVPGVTVAAGSSALANTVPPGTDLCCAPYLGVVNTAGKAIAWYRTDGDLLADDWVPRDSMTALEPQAKLPLRGGAGKAPVKRGLPTRGPVDPGFPSRKPALEEVES